MAVFFALGWIGADCCDWLLCRPVPQPLICGWTVGSPQAPVHPVPLFFTSFCCLFSAVQARCLALCGSLAVKLVVCAPANALLSLVLEGIAGSLLPLTSSAEGFGRVCQCSPCGGPRSYQRSGCSRGEGWVCWMIPACPAAHQRKGEQGLLLSRVANFVIF